MATDYGMVCSCDRMFFQLFCNASVCFIIFAGNYNTCSILIYPVNYTRSQLSVYT